MRSRLIALSLLVALAAAGCSNMQDPTGGPRRTTTTQPVEETTTTAPPRRICPLVGLDAGAEVDIKRPVYAVKIDNHPNARPQSGMPNADVIYEELVEGGLTRFLVVFHCRNAARIGPIRSARLVDPDLLVMYSPVLFGYSGAAPPVLSKVQSTAGVVDLVHGSNGPAYSRQGPKSAPHNLYTSTDKLLSLPRAQGVQGNVRTGYEFDPNLLATAPAPGTPGAGVEFAYSPAVSVSYAYDPNTKTYLRSQGGAPHKDESGAQLSATNVLVFKVPVQLVQGSAHITVVGEAEATVLRGGQSVTGKWRRPSLGEQFTLVDPAGQPIKLAPGNTFIHLLPSDRPVTVK